jgi:hypothetical protein
MDKLRVRLVLRLPDEQTPSTEPTFLDPLTIPARLHWREIERIDGTEQESRDV